MTTPQKPKPENADKDQKANRSSRDLAIKILTRWLQSGDFPDRLIPPGTPSRAFVMELVYGVVKRKRTLEWILAGCVERPPSPIVGTCLLVGLYQLIFMDEVAEYASVSETVETVKAKEPGAASFANAILRRVQREKKDILRALERQPVTIAESYPDLLVERWTRQFGAEKTAALCRWNNRPADVIVRPDRSRISMGDFLKALRERGLEARFHPFAQTEFLTLPRGARVGDLPGYQAGFFMVQDPSTSVSVKLLDPRPGETVLDACAAPGGKTVLISEAMRGQGRLVAMDLHADRIATLQHNLTRMKISHVSTVQGDAGRREALERASAGEKFDRILLDVPCSNTGVLRRRPDARWRFSKERLDALVQLQEAILTTAIEFLKPDGSLVYSTCSLEPEEGRDLVQTWIARNRSFKLVEDRALFPPDTQTDGIYAALIRKA